MYVTSHIRPSVPSVGLLCKGRRQNSSAAAPIFNSLLQLIYKILYIAIKRLRILKSGRGPSQFCKMSAKVTIWVTDCFRWFCELLCKVCGQREEILTSPQSIIYSTETVSGLSGRCCRGPISSPLYKSQPGFPTFVEDSVFLPFWGRRPFWSTIIC